MTLINIPATPIAIQILKIETALATLGIIAGDVTLKDIASVTLDPEYVTVTYMKSVKGAKECLRIERRIPILRELPSVKNTFQGPRPRLVAVDEAAHFATKGGPTDEEAGAPD